MMVVALFGDSCTGKSTIAAALAQTLSAEVFSGKDYLKLAKSESMAAALFKKKLCGEEPVIYVISEKKQLALLPEGCLRVLVTASLETIKERFAVRMHGKLPVPVASMLERKYGQFEAAAHDLRVDTDTVSAEEAAGKIRLLLNKKTLRVVDNEIRLIPYYRNDAVSLPWYQDLDVCKQVDNRDTPYTPELLHAMYDFLSSHGSCYYIEYLGVLAGDISLRDDGEIAIVVCKEYQNRHIGRRCVTEMLKLAKEAGMAAVRANIYSFNQQSRRMFLSIGFREIGHEWYEYRWR